jgi:hypothetical protein
MTEYKNGQITWIHISERRYTDGQQIYNEILDITNLAGKCKLTPNLLEWLPSKIWEITGVGDDVEKTEHLYTAGNNVN